MANDTQVRGMYPYNAPGYPPALLYFPANTATAIYRGAPVFINNSGQVQLVNVDTSANSNFATGVAWEFLDSQNAGLPSGLTNLPNSLFGTNIGPFLPGSTDAIVGVTYDPMQLYVMEEDTGGAALTVNSLGQAVSFAIQSNSGNNITGYANVVIDRSTVVSATANLLQLVNVVNILNQDGTVNAPGNYCKWVVRIQRHGFGNAFVSVPQ